MFRPLKRLEIKWNSHTPVWLHNGTKQNIIFQIIGGIVLSVLLIAKGEWEDRKLERSVRKNNPDLYLEKN